MSGIFAGRADRTVWKGGWREIGGFRKYYRSRWEANYARWLERERLEGRIQSWAHEPTTFWFEGIKRGVNNYLPDFHVVYPPDETGNSKEEYHEVKGWMDTKSATKIKRMEKYHPNVILVIVDTKVYKKLEKECCSTIEGWELLTKGGKDKEGEDGEEEESKPKPKRQPRKKTQKEEEVEPKPEDQEPVTKPNKGPSKRTLQRLEKELSL